MESKTLTEYLILADISGYTSYLATTELEHANIALSNLLETIVETMRHDLTISKLEGDAVLAYIEESQLLDSAPLLQLFDQTYLAFRNRVDTLQKINTCPCRACQAIPTLDLKFIVHYGDFIVQQVAGIKDLLGSDVNLLHRLAKNKVAQSTGWRGYTLFTLQGLEHIQTDKKAFVQQREAYEYLGEVETYVMDMHARYETMKAY